MTDFIKEKERCRKLYEEKFLTNQPLTSKEAWDLYKQKFINADLLCTRDPMLHDKYEKWLNAKGKDIDFGLEEDGETFLADLDVDLRRLIAKLVE